MESLIDVRRFRMSYDALNVPGTASRIADAIRSHRGVVKKCYLGAIIPVILPDETMPSKGALTFAHDFSYMTITVENYMEDVRIATHEALESFYVQLGHTDLIKNIRIQIAEVRPTKALHFSVYAEAKSTDGYVEFSTKILHDILNALYNTDVCADYIQHLNVDGLICMPVYSAEYLGNRMIYDLRCSMEIDHSHFEEGGFSETQSKIRAYLKSKINDIVGMQDYSIRQTHPSAPTITSCKHEINPPYRVQDKGFRVEYTGANIPGTALAVTRLFLSRGFEVRRAFIGEQSVEKAGSCRAIFKVYCSTDHKTEDIEAELRQILTSHYKSVFLPTPFNPEDLTVQVNSLAEREKGVRDDHYHVSCQIESSCEMDLIPSLLTLIASKPRLYKDGDEDAFSESSLEILQLIHTGRFAPPRSGEYAITDINVLCPIPKEKHQGETSPDREDRRILRLQRWLGEGIVELKGVRWVSVKPIFPPSPGIILCPDISH